MTRSMCPKASVLYFTAKVRFIKDNLIKYNYAKFY